MTTNLHSGKPSDNDDKLADAASLKPIKFKRLDKTARHIMSVSFRIIYFCIFIIIILESVFMFQILDKEEVEKVKSSREIPDIKPGYIVQLKIVSLSYMRINLICVYSATNFHFQHDSVKTENPCSQR